MSKKVIYTYGVWDLFHYGHLRALKKAASMGNKLIVGVFTDKQAEKFKRKPILNQRDRVKMIEELGIADMVVYQNTYFPTNKFLKDNKIDIVAQAEGAGWGKKSIPQFESAESILIPYTSGISTSDIIKKVYARCIEQST
jgi:cytidyltransferase-like protein